MNAVFQPGVALLNRLSFRGKFMLIGLILASVVGVLLVFLVNSLMGDIRFVQKEQRGLSYISQVVPVLIEVQKHRGLNGAHLGGDTSALAKLQDVEKKLDAQIVVVDQITANSEFGTAEKWNALKATWRDIKAGSSSYSRPQSFAEHTRLIGEIQSFMALISDASNITLDPQMDSYYLQDTAFNKLVELSEALGKLRAKGLAALASKTMTPEERAELTLLSGAVDNLGIAVQANLGKAAANNPAIKSEVDGAASKVSNEINNFRQTIQQELFAAELTMEPMAYFGQATSTITSVLDLYQQVEKSLVSVMQKREASLRQNMALYLVIVCALLLTATYFFIAMSAGISAAVKEIDHVVDAFAQGDLTRRIALSSRDEMGNIAGHFNQAGEHLRSVILRAEKSADALFAAAAGLKSTSGKISRDSESQNESVSSTAAAIEQITVSVGHVADSAHVASDAAAAALQLSENGEQTVRRAVSEMNSIASTVNHSSQLIDGLNRRARDISSITNVIRDIADQTNLLALNAAIEAARAGEQGRGFAVVADEVRKLAERTGNATGEITSMISEIQRETSNAVSSMEAGSAQAVRGVGLAEEAATALAEINAGANDTRVRIDEIAAAMREQSAATTDIAGNLERISVMSEDTNLEVQNAIDAINQLESLAEKLREDIMHFKV
jgi:methyl-accepting chemotaxis protein